MHRLVSKVLIVQVFALGCTVTRNITFCCKWLHVKHFGGKLRLFKGFWLWRDRGERSEFNEFAKALLLQILVGVFAVIRDVVKQVSNLDG